MELSTLLERLPMAHVLAHLESVCEQAAKGDLDYQGFFARALETEWRGRQQRSIEIRSGWPGSHGSKPWNSSTSNASPRLTARSCGNSLA